MYHRFNHSCLSPASVTTFPKLFVFYSLLELGRWTRYVCVFLLFVKVKVFLIDFRSELTNLSGFGGSKRSHLNFDT